MISSSEKMDIHTMKQIGLNDFIIFLTQKEINFHKQGDLNQIKELL